MIEKNESSDNFIISFWCYPFTKRIHTYYFERSYETDCKFRTYNNDPSGKVQRIESVDNLLEDGEIFVVGYVIL